MDEPVNVRQDAEHVLSDARQRADRAVTAVSGLCVMGGSMFLYYLTYKLGNEENAELRMGFTLFRGLRDYSIPDFYLVELGFWFLVVHLARLILGLNFIRTDNTLNIAMLKVYEWYEDEKKVYRRPVVERAEFVLRAILIVTIAIVTFSFGGFGSSCLYILIPTLTCQAVAMIFYYPYFWRAMFIHDSERKFNYIILASDLTSVTIIFIIVLTAIGIFGHWPPIFFVLIISGNTALFAAELYTQLAKNLMHCRVDIGDFWRLCRGPPVSKKLPPG